MDYSRFLIKEYDRWGLFLHQNQFPYLGRCYAWALRPEADLISDMEPDERDELFEIVMPAWEKAMRAFHNEFRSNLAILGNTSPHLHAHLIPRFRTPVRFDGIEFSDPNPDGNYAPYPKKEVPLETLLRIKNVMEERA